MSTNTKRCNKFAVLALSAGALALAGCGDESEGKSKNSSDAGASIGAGLLCFAIVLTSGDDECFTAAVSGGSGSGSGGTGSGGGGTGGGQSQPSADQTVYFKRAHELEPNDDLINANVPQFPYRANANEKTGWYAEGAINDSSDTRDVFALTARRDYRYRIELCPPGHGSCIPDIGIDPLTVFWRLLDYDGNEITSSQGDYSNREYVNLNAGLMYYIVVDAGDTMGARVGYRLYVHEQ